MISVQLRGLELRGAETKEDALFDWEYGKQFQVVGGPLVTNLDMKEMRKEGFDILEFRSSTNEYLATIELNPLLNGQITGPGVRT